ncbi:MAG: hypothetical protein SGI96_16270 [Bacteroidota bacterium]|nr:hypothetical protein [Bacteroidota bacterium]
MKLYIKNMVCHCCVMKVKSELEIFGYQPLNITRGELLLSNEMIDSEKEIFNQHLKTFGFEIIDDRKSRLTGQIKSCIFKIVHQHNSEIKIQSI